MKKYNINNPLFEQSPQLIDINKFFQRFAYMAIVFVGFIIDFLIHSWKLKTSIFAKSEPTYIFTIITIIIVLALIVKSKFKKHKTNKQKDYEFGLEMISRELFKEGRAPDFEIQEDDNDLYVKAILPVGMAKERILKGSGLFEDFFKYKLLRVQEGLGEVTLHFKKKDQALSIDYVFDKNSKIILGYDSYGDFIHWNTLLDPHLLVAAKTGGGKTSYLHTVVLQLKDKADDIIFVDFKGNEFGPLRRYGYTVFTELDGVVDALKRFREEMKRRQDQLIDKELRDYTQLGLKPKFMVFDEYAELVESFSDDKEGKAQKKEFEKLVASVARLGRSGGFYFILSTQQPNANILPTEIRNNFAQSVAIRGGDSTIQRMIFDEIVSEIEVPLDLGNHITNTHNGYEVLKAPYYDGNFFEDMKR